MNPSKIRPSDDQSAVQAFVNREVHYCVSALVSTLAGSDYSHGADDLGTLMDQAQELAFPIADFEEAAIQAGFSRTASGEWHSASKDATYSSAEDACEDWDLEPIDSEVFEHWIVSDWLADKLAEKGEKVDKDFAGLTVWARTTTGQGIASDAVIERIYDEMHSDAEPLAPEGFYIGHDIGGWYVATDDEAEVDDEGPSVGFDGRAHFATREAAIASIKPEA
jgi:hypothetical protein